MKCCLNRQGSFLVLRDQDLGKPSCLIVRWQKRTNNMVTLPTDPKDIRSCLSTQYPMNQIKLTRTVIKKTTYYNYLYLSQDESNHHMIIMTCYWRHQFCIKPHLYFIGLNFRCLFTMKSSSNVLLICLASSIVLRFAFTIRFLSLFFSFLISFLGFLAFSIPLFDGLRG